MLIPYWRTVSGRRWCRIPHLKLNLATCTNYRKMPASRKGANALFTCNWKVTVGVGHVKGRKGELQIGIAHAESRTFLHSLIYLCNPLVSRSERHFFAHSLSSKRVIRFYYSGLKSRCKKAAFASPPQKFRRHDVGYLHCGAGPHQANRRLHWQCIAEYFHCLHYHLDDFHRITLPCTVSDKSEMGMGRLYGDRSLVYKCRHVCRGYW